MQYKNHPFLIVQRYTEKTGTREHSGVVEESKGIGDRSMPGRVSMLQTKYHVNASS